MKAELLGIANEDLDGWKRFVENDFELGLGHDKTVLVSGLAKAGFSLNLIYRHVGDQYWVVFSVERGHEIRFFKLECSYDDYLDFHEVSVTEWRTV